MFSLLYCWEFRVCVFSFIHFLTLDRYFICVSEAIQALPSSSPYCTFPRWSTLAIMFNSSCMELREEQKLNGHQDVKSGQRYSMIRLHSSEVTVDNDLTAEIGLDLIKI